MYSEESKGKVKEAKFHRELEPFPHTSRSRFQFRAGLGDSVDSSQKVVSEKLSPGRMVFRGRCTRRNARTRLPSGIGSFKNDAEIFDSGQDVILLTAPMDEISL